MVSEWLGYLQKPELKEDFSVLFHVSQTVHQSSDWFAPFHYEGHPTEKNWILKVQVTTDDILAFETLRKHAYSNV